MKKTVCALILTTLFVVSAFAETDRTPLSDLDTFLNGVSEETPVVSISYSENKETADSGILLSDSDEISSVLEVLSQIEILESTDLDATDWYPLLTLSRADGETCQLAFTAHWLNYDNHNYQLQNDKAFWQLIQSLYNKYLAV